MGKRVGWREHNLHLNSKRFKELIFETSNNNKDWMVEMRG